MDVIGRIERLPVAILVCAAFVYAYPLSNFALHIDAELATYDPTVDHLVSLGRWGVALVRTIASTGPIEPFFQPAISVGLLTAAGLTAASVLRLGGTRRLVFALLYVALPQFAYQLEFPTQSDAVGLGLLLATLASGAIDRAIDGTGGGHRRLAHAAAALGCLILAMSIYQALLFVALSLCLLSSIADMTERDGDLGGTTRKIAATVIAIVLAYGVDLVISHLVQRALHVPADSGYLGSLVGWTAGPAGAAARDGLGAVWDGVLGGRFYGDGIYPTLLLPMFVVPLLPMRRRSALRVASVALLAVAVVALPFSISVLLGQAQAARTFLACATSFAGLWTLSIRPGWSPFARWSAIGLAAAAVLYGSAHVSRLLYADSVSVEADRLFGSRIVGAIERAYPSVDLATTPLYVSGRHVPANLWADAGFETFGRSFFEWDQGSPLRINAFLNVAAIVQTRLPPPERWAALNAGAAAMPRWPAPGSVRLLDGVVLVRLDR